MYFDGLIKNIRLAVRTEQSLTRKFGTKAWSEARIRALDDTLDRATRDACWRASEIIAAKYLIFQWKHPRDSCAAAQGDGRVETTPRPNSAVRTAPLRADH